MMVRLADPGSPRRPELGIGGPVAIVVSSPTLAERRAWIKAEDERNYQQWLHERATEEVAQALFGWLP